MSAHTGKKEKFYIEVPSAGIDESQKRLIKSLNFMLSHILTTTEESEYFDGSAEVMRMVASLVKQAAFNKQAGINEKIPYAEQVLEFSIDVLNEHIDQSKVVTYDC